jgi:deoxycytidine triphosphate deaminase
MILSKKTILEEFNNGNIIMNKLDSFDTQVKDQSVDVSLGKFLYIDGEWVDISNGFTPPRNTLILAYTDEFIGTKAGSNILPSFKLKSTAGRLGIMHTLAGHGEVGYFNRWALEFICLKDIELKEGMFIGQIYFTRTEGAENEDYSLTGTYQKHSDPKMVIDTWKREDILPKQLKVKPKIF